MLPPIPQQCSALLWSYEMPIGTSWELMSILLGQYNDAVLKHTGTNPLQNSQIKLEKLP